MSMKPMFCQCCERKYESPEDYLKGTSRFRVCSKGNLWFECSCGSGMILRKGEFEWYSPTLTMSDTAATIFKDVQEIKNIPLVPTAVMELQTVIADENSSSKTIEEALRHAPNIALGVLRTANNLRASSSLEFNSISHAISYIGRQTVNDIVLSETLQDFDFKCHHFSKDSYWQEAILTGKIAEYLAHRYAPDISKDEAYIAGSLVNIGKIVSAICFPQITDDVAKAVANPRRPKSWTYAEDQLRVYSHTVLGEIAAALWGFPEYVVHALSYHHSLPKDVPDLVQDDCDFLDDDTSTNEKSGPTLQQIVAIANQYAHWVLLQPSRMDEILFDHYARIMGLDEKAKDLLGEELMSLRPQAA